ncbi:hypothetical protein [Pleomorphomonas oryzae]|uniref:hypothetical protein n=1 Tax=Pleomorphomonas oryzae TaxID=261934 RepID=UPI0012EB4C52|nr:hypothetical protein [Pleomorphomonas oryzae]
MKYMLFGLRAAAYVVLSFACAGFALADDWTCTQPPTANISKGIEKLSGSKQFESIDRRAVDFIERPLKKRLGFKSSIVSCHGSSCRIGREFIRFIDGKIELPTREMPMSICWVHDPHIAYCDRVACSPPPENHSVVYLWDDGELSLSLDKLKTKENQLPINEVHENNLAYDPDVKDYHSRVVGVARDASVMIFLETYNKR